MKIESNENDRGWTISGGGCAVDHLGTCTMTMNFETGSWKITVSHGTIGRREQDFTIEAGETTTIEIAREEFLKQ